MTVSSTATRGVRLFADPLAEVDLSALPRLLPSEGPAPVLAVLHDLVPSYLDAYAAEI